MRSPSPRPCRSLLPRCAGWANERGVCWEAAEVTIGARMLTRPGGGYFRRIVIRMGVRFVVLLLLVFGTVVAGAPAGVATGSGRASDAVRWNGGDWLEGGDCSSGIPVRNASGNYFLLTAAHCFSVGRVIENYFWWGGNTYGNPSNVMGEIYVQSPAPVDAELLNTCSSPRVWNSPYYVGSPTQATFIGAGPLSVGSTFCVSGAYEGEHCGVSVTEVTPNGDPVVWGVKSGIQVVGHGDSGGPAYQYCGGPSNSVCGGSPGFGSVVKAVGVIAAFYPSGACTVWAVSGRMCGSVVGIVPIAIPLSQWNLQVTTS